MNLNTISLALVGKANKGWSEPVATSAPVQDEAVQAVLGMIQKHVLPSPRFLVFSTSFLLPKFFPPTYFTSFCAHSIIKAKESLQREGRKGRAELGARSGREKMAIRTTHLKQEPKMRRQSGSLNVNSLPSLHFFGCFFTWCC